MNTPYGYAFLVFPTRFIYFFLTFKLVLLIDIVYNVM